MAASEEKSYQMGILYGQVYRIVRDALNKDAKRKDRDCYGIDSFTTDNVFYHPDTGLALLMRKAFASRALTPQDEDRIGYYMDGIDPTWHEDGYDKDQFACGVGVGIRKAHTVSAAEAARSLCVTPGRVTQMIAEGKLKAIKVRGSVYVTPGSLETCKRNMSKGEEE